MMDPDLLPDHGAHLHLAARDNLEALDLVLDVARGLFHVLRDDEERWEGRTRLDPLERAAWARRVAGLQPAQVEGMGSTGRLVWRGDSLDGHGAVSGRPIGEVGSRAVGSAALARDLLALALRSRIDHPIAASALNRWNQVLRFAATVTFADGSPRRVRLVGMVDAAGLANLRALVRVLRSEEPLIVDLTGCASLGAWDPGELVQGHAVAWVGAEAAWPTPCTTWACPARPSTRPSAPPARG